MPVTPDEIRSGSQRTVLFNYERFKYVCDCLNGPKHVTYCTFDQMPPNYCPGNRRMYRDPTWIDPDYHSIPQTQSLPAPSSPTPDWDITPAEDVVKGAE